MKKITRKIFFGIVIFSIVFSPLSFSSFQYLSQAADGEEVIVDYQEWNQDRIIDRNVVIESGATLVIGKGVDITFTEPWIGIDVMGSLFINGTVKEKATIKSDLTMGSFAITAQEGARISIRNAEIINGGSSAQLIRNNFSTAVAANYRGAIQVDGGSVDVQNTTFKNNMYAVVTSNPDAVVRVNRSRFVDNGFDVETVGAADFRYNWWGDPAGPQETCYDYGESQICNFEKIYGDFDYSQWLTGESFRDPVIIIPGIMGSWEEEGQLQLDPIFHTYDNLQDGFIGNGYTLGSDLFVFPYEWRDSNIENAKKLKAKIEEIKQQKNWPKVDVVAHSMGGLLAREYIEADYYGGDVDQLITLATPNLGAPEAYMKWDGDGWFFSLVDIFMKHIVTQEAEENNFSDRFEYMHNRPVASLQELLPVYDYLYEADNNNQLRVYPNGYPRNSFLENLNSRTDRLKAVEYDKIVGNTGGNNTIGGVDVVDADMGKYWAHGYPLGFEIPTGDRGMRYIIGDITVPIVSSKSENIKSDNLIELASDHRSIVTDAQKDVLELLTGVRPGSEVRDNLIRNIFIAQVFSPIDIQIIAPDGKRVGKDFATGEILNEIENAYYSGFETENEFLTIPDPIKGEYRILTQGTGDGAYRIEATEIGQNSNGIAVEKTSIVEGVATTGAQEEKIIQINGIQEDEEEKDQAPPEARIFFSTETNSIIVEGIDENPTTVAYSTVDTTSKKGKRQKEKITIATITDQAGNTTALAYVERPRSNSSHRENIEIRSISYNGNSTDLKNTSLQYKWQLDRQNKYRLLASHIHTIVTALESHYLSKKNQTWIMEKPRELADDDRDDDSEKRVVKTKLPGMVVPALVTEKGVVKIKY